MGINRIVMMRGGVETLDYFSTQMAQTFEERGFLVFFHDLEDPMRSAKRLRKYMRPGETALVTFNFEGLENEKGVYEEGTGYIWDTFRVACYNIAVDHPYYYHERLKNLPRDYHHISIDENHEKYFKHFYPEFDHAGFLPLAGTRLLGGGADAIRSGGDADLPIPKDYAARPTDIIFTGNYTELPFFEPYINWINEEYAAFYRGIIDELITCPDRTVEEVALAHCEREMGENTTEDLRQALYKMLFIDMYVRNYWRGKAVQVIADAGIMIDVVGKGWEKLPLSHPENLRIHDQTDSATCLRMIGKSKISLNVMPWFKNGAHDRVFNSVANGTLCLTDPSIYMEKELPDGIGVKYYRLNAIERLPEIVGALLADPGKMTDMVHRGMPVVTSRHMWKNRADQMIGWMQS
jgi:hypothetical protein